MAGKEAKVKIRPMEPEDIDAVLTIDRKISGVQRAITYRDLVRDFLGGQIDLSFVAEAENQVIGFVVAYLTYVAEKVTEACVIQILGVDPDYGRQGIATKLIQAQLDECRSKKIKQVRVMIEERDNQLQSFFKHVGFDRSRYLVYSRTL
jgi:predicted N-acetyltransferase YhbS